MIVDRKWTKKVNDAVTKAQQMLPGHVLTLVDTRDRSFMGLSIRRVYKKRVEDYRVVQPFGTMQLLTVNEKLDNQLLPANWVFPAIYDKDWDGTITDHHLVVKEFW